MKKTLLSSSIALFLILISFAGHAVVVTWQLVDVTFTDGGVATGVFDYDADTDTYSAINIETSGGSEPSFANTPSYGVPSDVLFTPNAALFSTVPTLLSDYTGSFFFGILFATSLTNAGGTVPVDSSAITGELVCGNAACSAIPAPIPGPGIRVITGGSVSAVPLPAAAWLFGSGLVGLIGVARRKRRHLILGTRH